MDYQREKERACYLAATLGVALFSRGHRVYAVQPTGRVRLVCGARNMIELWAKAHEVLRAEAASFAAPQGPRFRMRTPSGTYVSSTWLGLLLNWLFDRPLCPPVDGR